MKLGTKAGASTLNLAKSWNIFGSKTDDSIFIVFVGTKAMVGLKAGVFRLKEVW